jgi:pyruvate ferredoxin oxidoreductase beta subunit
VSEKAFKSIKEISREEYFSRGHRACPGCGEALVARYILKAVGKDVVVVSVTGCLEVISSPYPQTAWRVPWLHVAFENAASVASGVEAAYKALMRKKKIPEEEINIVAMAGDGGTADIGLQALSGALERGHNFLYVCYDNEAYMNTGIQRSGATPYGASTTTSPAGKFSIGNITWKKDIPGIAAAHHIPYVATASVGFPLDLMNKVVKGVKVNGPAYIHCLCPCPPGWRFSADLTIEMGKLAVFTGLWPLYEIEDGKLKLTVRVGKRKPVTEYLKLQGRFKHLKEKEIAYIQERADITAQELGLGPVT